MEFHFDFCSIMLHLSDDNVILIRNPNYTRYKIKISNMLMNFQYDK